METLKTEIVRTTIDLPAELNAKLVREAGRKKRSRHAQMLIALEKFFDAPRHTDDGEQEKAK